MLLRNFRQSKGLALAWIGWAEMRAQPGRALLAAAAIAIGVALGFAVHLVNASALNEFARAVQAVNGNADLQVHSVTPRGLDERLYPKVATVSGVADASPVLELQASSDDVTFTLLGLDVFRAATVTPLLLGRPAGENDSGGEFAGTQSLSENTVFLSPSLLSSVRKNIGDDISITAAGKSSVVRISGTLPGISEENLAVMDIATAQWRFGTPGLIHRIDVKAAEGVDIARLHSAIKGVLSPDAEIVTRESEQTRTGSLSRAYRINLDMLALMALLTGAFLAYSAQALAVARRHAQFALLRVLGMRRKMILAQVLVEGAAMGVVGGIAGLLLGWLLAATALRFLGGDLGGGYFTGTRPELVFAPGAAVFFFALGIVCAVTGSVLPARAAAHAEPAIAIKRSGDIADPKKPPNAMPPLVLLVCGAAAAFLPPVNDVPLFGYIAIALILAGGIAGMPLLARLLLSPLRRLSFCAPADLALKHLWGAPDQAAIALCGMVASTSLMIAMAIMIWSFRTSVDAWLVQILPSDIYLRIDSDSSDALTPDLQRYIAALPGVRAVHFRKHMSLRLSPELPAVDFMAADLNHRNPSGILPLIGQSFAVPRGAMPVWVSEPARWIYGFRPGDSISLPIGGSKTDAVMRFFVAGEWRDYGRQQGSIALDLADYTALTGDDLCTDAAIDLRPRADAKQVMTSIAAVLPHSLAGRVTLAESRSIRALSLRIFDRSFAVTYLLEGIAILVGLAGIAATFSTQTLARSKEFGMLRHIGVLRRQIVAMLAIEGALLGFVGVLAGIGLGLAISQVLIQVINPESFHWTMDVRVPFELLGSVTVALIAASAGTALIAGRNALSRHTVMAVREDW